MTELKKYFEHYDELDREIRLTQEDVRIKERSYQHAKKDLIADYLITLGPLTASGGILALSSQYNLPGIQVLSTLAAVASAVWMGGSLFLIAGGNSGSISQARKEFKQNKEKLSRLENSL